MYLELALGPGVIGTGGAPSASCTNVFERMLAEGTDSSVATQLAEARARLAELTCDVTP